MLDRPHTLWPDQQLATFPHFIEVKCTSAFIKNYGSTSYVGIEQVGRMVGNKDGIMDSGCYSREVLIVSLSSNIHGPWDEASIKF